MFLVKTFFQPTQLVFSCSDTSTSCHRFLDLTGPLYIGGLPTGIITDDDAADNSFNYRQFDGCIRDLHIDEVPIDFSEYRRMDGRNVVAGCNRRDEHCSSNACRSGKCRDAWTNFECECPSMTTGRNCAKGIALRPFD